MQMVKQHNLHADTIENDNNVIIEVLNERSMQEFVLKLLFILLHKINFFSEQKKKKFMFKQCYLMSKKVIPRSCFSTLGI